MNYPICSVRDVKTGFMAPTIDLNPDAAVRAFHLAVTKSPDVLGAYPKDFDLYQVGIFDSDSGSITPVVPIVWLTNGADALHASREVSSDA